MHKQVYGEPQFFKIYFVYQQKKHATYVQYSALCTHKIAWSEGVHNKKRNLYIV